MSLDDFLSNFTSEDNASFSVILDKMQKRHRQFYEAARDIENQKAIAAKAQLMLPAPVGSNTKPAAVETWAYTSKNALMFNDEKYPFFFFFLLSISFFRFLSLLTLEFLLSLFSFLFFSFLFI